MVRTSRCGRDNPGSTPGEDIFARSVRRAIFRLTLVTHAIMYVCMRVVAMRPERTLDSYGGRCRHRDVPAGMPRATLVDAIYRVWRVSGRVPWTCGLPCRVNRPAKQEPAAGVCEHK